MKAKPKDESLLDGIKVTSKAELLKEPEMIATKAIKLSRSHPIAAINLLFPPGISKFYVERLNKNEIRFLVRTSEISRMAEKAEEMMKGAKGKKLSNEVNE